MKTAAFIGLYLSAIALGLGISTLFSDVPLLERYKFQLVYPGLLTFFVAWDRLNDGKA
jgi:hypothetical protein